MYCNGIELMLRLNEISSKHLNLRDWVAVGLD